MPVTSNHPNERRLDLCHFANSKKVVYKITTRGGGLLAAHGLSGIER